VPVIGSLSVFQQKEKDKNLVPTAGPNHAASALCMWAV
jgi:hypothetical protein